MSHRARALCLGALLTGCFGELKPATDAAADARVDAPRADAPADLPTDNPAPDAAPDVAPPDVTPPPDAAPPDAADDVALDAADDVAQDAAPDVDDAQVTPPDAADDASVDVSLDAARDVVDAGDAAPDRVAIDAPPLDVPRDVAADVARDAAPDVAPDPTIPAPRLVAPLSVSRVGRRVRFAWVLTPELDGAVVEVCRDRACAMVEASFVGTGDKLTTTSELTAGYRWWRARGRRGGRVGAQVTSAWELYVPPRRNPTGPTNPSAWGAMPDVNGDGRSDLVVAAPNAQVGALARPGAAYLHPGVADGFQATPSLTFNMASPRAGFGQRVTPLQDVDGDGWAEHAVVGNDYVVVYRGGATPTVTAHRTYENWQSAAPAGDVNGDGYGDLLLAAGSRVALVLGSATGLAATATRTVTGASAAVGLGDLDDDGYGEVAVQVANDRVSVYRGTATGLQPTPTYSLDGPRGYLLDAMALAGDVNADGVVDLVFSATLSGAAGPSRGVLVPLSPLPFVRATAPVVLAPPTTPRLGEFGNGVGTAGDVNGDGIDDVAVGTGVNSGTVANHVCVYAGSALGPVSSPLVCVTQPGASRFGASVGSAGDVNGDGFEDLLAGARGSTDGMRGSVRVYRGRLAGVLDPAALTVTGGDVNANFGADLGGWR